MCPAPSRRGAGCVFRRAFGFLTAAFLAGAFFGAAFAVAPAFFARAGRAAFLAPFLAFAAERPFFGAAFFAFARGELFFAVAVGRFAFAARAAFALFFDDALLMVSPFPSRPVQDAATEGPRPAILRDGTRSAISASFGQRGASEQRD